MAKTRREVHAEILEDRELEHTGDVYRQELVIELLLDIRDELTKLNQNK